MRSKVWALVLLCAAGGGTSVGQTLEFFGSEISTPAAFAGVTQGIAVGDFNGDGKPDLALVTSGGFLQLQATIVVILLGNGDGTFRKGALYPTTGTNSQTVVVGDFTETASRIWLCPILAASCNLQTSLFCLEMATERSSRQPACH